MMHKAWRSTEEVPYCFSRSSIKFHGHTSRKIDDLNPIWDYLAGRSYQIPQICLVCMFSHKFSMYTMNIVILNKNLVLHYKTSSVEFSNLASLCINAQHVGVYFGKFGWQSSGFH